MAVSVLGSINMDVVLGVDALPKSGETITARSKTLFPGGKGANQAIAAARADAKTTLYGAVGDDSYGPRLVLELQYAGVGTNNVETLKQVDSGQAFINVGCDGQNAIVVVPGANHVYELSYVAGADAAKDAVRLTQLEMPLDAIGHFFSVAGGIRILNAAPAIPEATELFRLSDILVFNETELAVFSDKPVDSSDRSSLANAARALITWDDQIVIVTLGNRGCMAVGLNRMDVVPGFSASVVDTTGAGDCFCGVLAASLSAGEGLEGALVIANAAASIAVETAGAGPSMPTRAQITGRLKSASAPIVRFGKAFAE